MESIYVNVFFTQSRRNCQSILQALWTYPVSAEPGGDDDLSCLHFDGVHLCPCLFLPIQKEIASASFTLCLWTYPVSAEPGRDDNLSGLHFEELLPQVPAAPDLLDEGGQVVHALPATLLQVKQLQQQRGAPINLQLTPRSATQPCTADTQQQQYNIGTCSPCHQVLKKPCVCVCVLFVCVCVCVCACVRACMCVCSRWRREQGIC